MAEPSETLSEILRELKHSKDWRERRAMALKLGRCRRPEVFPALVGALGDRDPEVRHAAVLSLGQLGGPQTVETLCLPKVLEDPSPDVRWAAVTVLGRLGSLGITNALSKALQDSEWVVRNQAHLALSEFIRRIPADVDSHEIKKMIRLLLIPDAELRNEVVSALSRRTAQGLEEMEEALKGMSRVVRAGVAEAMGLSRDSRTVMPLIEATADPVARVRATAATALGRLRDERAVEPLILILADSSNESARAAVDALVAIGEPAARHLCLGLEYAKTKTHRRNIIRALGGIRHPDALVPLLNNLANPYYVVRTAAVAALSAYGESAVERLIDMAQVCDVPLAPLLEAAGREGYTRLRLRAIRALGEIKNAAALRYLRRLVQDPDRDVANTAEKALVTVTLAVWGRHGAIVALGGIGDRRAGAALVEALRDHSEVIRAEAARTLARLDYREAIPELIRVLAEDEDAAVRRETAWALHNLGAQSPDVSAAFRVALQDTHWEVRTEAARGLGRIDDEASVTSLIEALEDASYSVRTAAEHALANLGALAVPGLLQAAGGPDSTRRESAIGSLVEILSTDYLTDLEGLLDSPPEERAARVQALSRRLGC